jgi:hypothetical protein
MLPPVKGLVPPSWGRLPLRYVGVGATIVSLLLLIASHHTRLYLPSWPSRPTPTSSEGEVIPNTVHLVYILPEDATDFTFQFSRKYYLKPSKEPTWRITL